jgi:SAM-dependent methyltransferase
MKRQSLPGSKDWIDELELPGKHNQEDVDLSIIRSVFSLIKWFLGALLVYILFVEVVLRIVRRFYQFPIPAYAARLIDNPIRRRIQPPDRIAEWMGAGEGMSILDVGPGPGTFTFAVARRVGKAGCVYAIDIQESIVSALSEKVEQRGITNISVRLASAYTLPFSDQYFDRIYMVAVLGEIPDKQRALSEFKRVLKDDGLLAIGEFLPDPDYPRRKTVANWCQESGFILTEQYGNLLHYLLLFIKQE